ncbi:MAG: Gfo/Idh/MocA family oxidoreductase [Trichococcus sp.]|nr:Gfo/Idh/MocA family oxidoreductase [Trichococcus sp.]
MKKLKVTIIGYGGMGSFHAKLIQANPEVEVHGIFDISESRQQAGEADGYSAYASLEEALNDACADTILIATPNDVHKEIAVQALEAGKHVICEKPVTLTSEELSEIMNTAEEQGRVFMVHQNRRWDSDFQMVKDLYEKRKIGEIFHIESRVQGANGIPGDWRHLKAHGGGMLLDWGVHLFDQLLYMVDSPLAKVAADLSYILGDEVDDGFISYLTFENGVTALVEVGTTNYIKLPRWYIKGTKGSAVIEDWDLKGKIVKQSGLEFVVAPKPIKAGQGLTKTMAPPSEESIIKEKFEKVATQMDPFYTNFAKVVRGESEPIVKNEEVLQLMKIIESIFEAAETGQVIDVREHSYSR